MTLVPMPDGISLAEWERVLTAIEECHAPGTRAVYASHWKKWQLWCSAHGVPDLPASAEDLAAYLVDQATSYAMNTVRTAAASRELTSWTSRYSGSVGLLHSGDCCNAALLGSPCEGIDCVKRRWS